MADITTFYLVRHGESYCNKHKIVQGWFDNPLSDEGRLQVQAAGDYLKDIHFDYAYSSDLGRVVETCSAILKYHPETPVEYDPALREWHLGPLEGRPRAECVEKYPDLLNAIGNEYEKIDCSDVESREEFQQRVEEFLNKTALKHPGKTILVCSHGGTLKRALRMLTGPFTPPNHLPINGNAAINIVHYHHAVDAWQLDVWNYMGHIDKLNITESKTL